MKNILKKIGIIGLIIAVLSPFIELTSVNAETCEKHLQNYMFLDVNAITNDFLQNYIKVKGSTSGVSGYQTYTKYPYAFTNNANSKIKINWIEPNTFKKTDTLDENLERYWKLSSKEGETYLSTEDYYQLKELQESGIIFVEEESHKLPDSYYKDNTYADNTIIFHGLWSSFDNNGKETFERAENIDYSNGPSISLQKVLSKKNDLGKMVVDFQPAKYNSKTGRFGIDSDRPEIKADYFQDIVDGKLEYKIGDSKFIPIAITRTIEVDSEAAKAEFLNRYTYGKKSSDGKYYIYTKNTNAEKIEDINDSYDTYMEWISMSAEQRQAAGESGKYYSISSDKFEFDMDDIDFDVKSQYYWPVVLTVDYSSCADETVVSKWTVEYDDNVEDNSVIDTPDSQKENVGTPITVSSKKPTRNGYAFQKWCETSNGSGACYNAGDKVKSPTESTTVKLYAQWAKEGTEDNKKTGVVSYIIGFVAVGVVAGGIYLISKKKNVFKQI